MFETILLATDGSENAGRAAAAAGHLAKVCDAQLIIVHVAAPYTGLAEITESPLGKSLPADVQGDIDDLLKRMGGWEQTPFAQVPAPESAVRFLSETAIEATAEIARKNGATKIEKALTVGDAPSEILAEAEKRKASLIVMGTRGQSNVKQMLIGSVSQKVLHLASCPCLLVK